MPSDLPPHPERRAAVVTGASSGIGLATALMLAGAGHPVVLGARRLDRLEATAASIVEQGGEALALPLDLTDNASIDAFAARADDEMGPIEILVSNAGEVFPTATLTADPDDFAREVQLNLVGAQRLLRALGPGMVERRRGDIVLVSSDVVRMPRPSMASYVASKHALEGLGRAMQMELEGTGVRVGVVRPGPSFTEQGSRWESPMLDEVLAEWDRWGLMRHSGILGPDDLARAVLTMVTTQRGAHVTLIEVQPEAPIGGTP